MRQEKEIPKILLPALRQYQHNDGSGLVIGFDRDETVKIVNMLLEAIEAQSNARRAYHGNE